MVTMSGLHPFCPKAAMKEYKQKDRSYLVLFDFLKNTVSTVISVVGDFWLKLVLTFCSSTEVFQNGQGHFSTVSPMWIMNLYMIEKYIN